jgi:hypothetical protein
VLRHLICCFASQLLATEVQSVQAASLRQGRQGLPRSLSSTFHSRNRFAHSIRCLQDPKWLTAATLTNPAALWEVSSTHVDLFTCTASTMYIHYLHAASWMACSYSREAVEYLLWSTAVGRGRCSMGLRELGARTGICRWPNLQV